VAWHGESADTSSASPSEVLKRCTLTRRRLSRNIAAFHRYITPTRAEKLARHEVRTEIFRAIKAGAPRSVRFKPFGSIASHLSTADADMDIRCYLAGSSRDVLPPSREDRAKVVGHLRGIAARMVQPGGGACGGGGFYGIVGRHSRYPLLDMRHRRSQMTLQIVSANSAHLSTESVKGFADRLPSLAPLYGVLRTMLKVRGLSDVYRGGLSSYPLVNMIAASLQLRPGRSLAEDLLNFLRLYSTLDTSAKVVSLAPPAVHDRDALPQPTTGAKVLPLTAGTKVLSLTPPAIHDHDTLPPATTTTTTTTTDVDDDARLRHLADMAHKSHSHGLGFMLCLQDPADPTNDLGRKTFAWRHVAATFGHAHRRLLRLLRAHDRDLQLPKRERRRRRRGGEAAPAPAAFLLGELVGPCARLFARRRRAMRRFGRAVLPPAVPAGRVGARRREAGARALVATRRRRLGIATPWARADGRPLVVRRGSRARDGDRLESVYM
jgi:non-canonical poly(A) RNA polymerase PAPD5/7